MIRPAIVVSLVAFFAAFGWLVREAVRTAFSDEARRFRDVDALSERVRADLKVEKAERKQDARRVS